MLVRMLNREPPTILRTFWQWALQLWFRLFQRHRHGRVVLEQVGDYPLIVLPGVMNPRLFRTGSFLATSLTAAHIPAGCTVLDMGTGSGIGAIAAARWAGRVVAVDVNPEAVRCARMNVLLNRVETKVDVRQGDLFAPVSGERFDVVLFNPPFFRGEPAGGFDTAWRARDTVERFTAGLAGHLTTGGCALVILSSMGDEAAFLQAFAAHGLQVTVSGRKDLLNEVLTIYQLAPAS